MTALERRRLRLFLRILGISTVIGGVFGAYLAPAGSALLHVSILIGAANSLVIAGGISGIEIFLLRACTSAGRLTRLPFSAVVGLKTLVYGAIVTGVVVSAPLFVNLLPVAARASPLGGRGAIYQYVGDEIVVTWTEADGIPEAHPLRCFFMMEESLDRLKEQFQTRFATQPGLRAALHLGEVIAGEVGEAR